MIEIRSANKERIEELTTLFMLAYNDDKLWKENWSFEDAKEHLMELLDCPGVSCLVCEKDQCVIGCIMYVSMCWYNGKRIEIKELFVSPLYQRQGYGRVLLSEISKIASDAGIEEVSLWTQNCSELKEFYQKYGFEIDNSLIQMKLNII